MIYGEKEGRRAESNGVALIPPKVFLVIKKSSFNGVVVRIKGDKILTYKSAPTLIGRIFPFISIISMAGDNFIEGVDWVLEKKYSN